jgi:hypothetical protein
LSGPITITSTFSFSASSTICCAGLPSDIYGAVGNTFLRPSKEFDARFATESFAPNEMQNSTRWYQQMYDEAKAHLAQH